MIPNYPDWAPFACLITGKLSSAIRKSVVVRVIEGVLMSAIGGLFAIAVGLPVIANDYGNHKERVSEHIKWAISQIERSDRQDEEQRREIAQMRTDIMNGIISIQRLLRENKK